MALDIWQHVYHSPVPDCGKQVESRKKIRMHSRHRILGLKASMQFPKPGKLRGTNKFIARPDILFKKPTWLAPLDPSVSYEKKTLHRELSKGL
jgi:hypothetical protein